MKEIRQHFQEQKIHPNVPTTGEKQRTRSEIAGRFLLFPNSEYSEANGRADGHVSIAIWEALSGSATQKHKISTQNAVQVREVNDRHLVPRRVGILHH